VCEPSITYKPLSATVHDTMPIVRRPCPCPFVQEATSGGGLDLITRTLVAHVASEGVVADGMALLKTLGHSDVNKRLYCDPTVGTYALMLQVRRTWVVSLRSMTFTRAQGVSGYRIGLGEGDGEREWQKYMLGPIETRGGGDTQP
jgi:hypothetical protein